MSHRRPALCGDFLPGIPSFVSHHKIYQSAQAHDVVGHRQSAEKGAHRNHTLPEKADDRRTIKLHRAQARDLRAGGHRRSDQTHSGAPPG